MQDARGCERFGRVERVTRGEPCEPRCEPQLRVVAEHRNRRSERCRPLSRDAEAYSERVLDPREPNRMTSSTLARGGRNAGARQLTERLPDEERIAAGDAVKCGGEAVIGWRPERHLSQPGHGLERQAARAQELDAWVRGERIQEIARGAGLALPRGHDQRERKAIEPLGQIEQPAQRRQVGPVQIVDEREDGRPCGQVGNEPPETMQRAERRVAGDRLACGLRRQHALRQGRRTDGGSVRSAPAAVASGGSSN